MLQQGQTHRGPWKGYGKRPWWRFLGRSVQAQFFPGQVCGIFYCEKSPSLWAALSSTSTLVQMEQNYCENYLSWIKTSTAWLKSLRKGRRYCILYLLSVRLISTEPSNYGSLKPHCYWLSLLCQTCLHLLILEMFWNIPNICTLKEEKT